MDPKDISFILKDHGWDGKFPIPVSYFGGASVPQVEKMTDIIAFSGDDKAIWVGTIETAVSLVKEGHNIVTDPKILDKRKAYLRNKNLRDIYPMWEEWSRIYSDRYLAGNSSYG